MRFPIRQAAIATALALVPAIPASTAWAGGNTVPPVSESVTLPTGVSLGVCIGVDTTGTSATQSSDQSNQQKCTGSIAPLSQGQVDITVHGADVGLSPPDTSGCGNNVGAVVNTLPATGATVQTVDATVTGVTTGGKPISEQVDSVTVPVNVPLFVSACAYPGANQNQSGGSTPASSGSGGSNAGSGGSNPAAGTQQQPSQTGSGSTNNGLKDATHKKHKKHKKHRKHKKHKRH
jgi:hypothetical protein